MTSTTADVPFLPDIAPIVVCVPVPPSVNKTRKVDWRTRSVSDAWTKQADMMMFRAGRLPKPITGSFEIKITLDEATCRADLDNLPKIAIDYLRRLKLITNDSPKYMRRLVMEWGSVPEGCRMTITPSEPGPVTTADYVRGRG